MSIKDKKNEGSQGESLVIPFLELKGKIVKQTGQKGVSELPKCLRIPVYVKGDPVSSSG